MLLIVLIAVGLAVIIVGSLALVRNIRRARAPEQKRLAIVLAFAVGLALSAGSFFVVYPYGDDARIVGELRAVDVADWLRICAEAERGHAA